MVTFELSVAVTSITYAQDPLVMSYEAGLTYAVGDTYGLTVHYELGMTAPQTGLVRRVL